MKNVVIPEMVKPIMVEIIKNRSYINANFILIVLTFEMSSIPVGLNFISTINVSFIPTN